jgi:hypothetical protein
MFWESQTFSNSSVPQWCKLNQVFRVGGMFGYMRVGGEGNNHMHGNDRWKIPGSGNILLKFVSAAYILFDTKLYSAKTNESYNHKLPVIKEVINQKEEKVQM